MPHGRCSCDVRELLLPCTSRHALEVSMTAGERTLCDCPEPCGCYAEGHAAGRERAYSLVLAAPHDPAWW